MVAHPSGATGIMVPYDRRENTMLTRITVAISVLCLVLPVGTLAQGFRQGDKEILLNGAGVSDKDFDNTTFSITGSLGYFATNNISAAFRQSLAFSNIENGGSSWNATSLGALDYNLDLGRWWPFVGGNIGYVYGHHVNDTWEAGIEGGLKFFVNPTTFILGMMQYQWFFDSDSNNNGFSDGQWVYVVGLGFKW
jgi:hypothetical protein